MLQQISTYIFLVLIVELNGLQKLAKKIKIIQGDSAKIEHYPYQVEIIFGTHHKCGGSTINPSTILTAAHCVYKYRYKSEYFFVRAGSSYVNRDGTISKVKKIHVHHKYHTGSYDFDVAILKLNVNFTFGRTIQPVRLPKRYSKIKSGTEGIATGWGRITQSGPIYDPLQLQVVSLPILSDEECKIYHPAGLSSRMICAGDIYGGKDTCQGDSGGPLIVEGIQVGITSWGVGCGHPASPGVYTKVSSVLDFIYKYVDDDYY